MKALDIGRLPREKWKQAIEALPEECPCKGVCTGGMGCRERVADYMRTQWHMLAKREKRRGGAR